MRPTMPSNSAPNNGSTPNEASATMPRASGRRLPPWGTCGLLGLLLSIAAVACHHDPPASSAPAEPAPVPSTPGAILAATVAAGGPNGFSTQTQAVRREPREGDDGTKKKRAVAPVASLERGEQVTTFERRGDWVQVRLSDGKLGWLKTAGVVDAPGAKLVAPWQKIKTFSRPDFLAFLPDKQVTPGTLLVWLRNKDQFSEVNVRGDTTAWVLSATVTDDPTEVEAAKLLGRVQALKERNDPSADAAWDLAKNQFGDTRMLRDLLLAEQAAQAQDANRPLDPNGINGQQRNLDPKMLPMVAPRVDGPAPSLPGH